jgi:hypothetical protein
MGGHEIAAAPDGGDDERDAYPAASETVCRRSLSLF